MANVFSETTSQGFGQRIKSSFAGIVVGLGMFVAAFPLQWWNEGRAVRRTEGLNEDELAALVTVLQRGRISVYLMYSFATLLALLFFIR